MKLNRFFSVIIGIFLFMVFACNISDAATCIDALERQEQEAIENNPYYKFVDKINDLISKNDEYKKLYNKFGEKGLSTSDRQKITEEILYKLTNADNIDETSRGKYVNAKHLAVIEYYMDEKFISTSPDKISQENPKNPNIVAGAKLESLYEQIKAGIYAEFASRLLIKDLIECSSVYLNIVTESIEWHFQKLVQKLDDELNTNPERAKDRIYNFGAWVKGMQYDNQESFFNPFDDDCFYTHFTKNDRELKWQWDSIGKIIYDLDKNEPSKQGDEAVKAKENTPLIDFHARRGDDVVYGSNLDDSLIGGTGNDILDGGDGNDELYAWSGDDIIWGGNGDDTIYAGEGNDIIIAGDGDDVISPDYQDKEDKTAADGNDIVNAGKGNDRIYSLYGDDKYIFNIGDGHDIIEDKNGEDTIYWGNGISAKDVKFQRVNNDLILKIKDDDNSITIKKYYIKRIFRKNENLYKIENIQFADDSSFKKIRLNDLFVE